jgi:hypothetical protein
MNKTEIDAVERYIEIYKASGSLEELDKLSADFSPEMQELLATMKDLTTLADIKVSREQMDRSLSALLAHAETLNSKKGHEKRTNGSVSFGMWIRGLLSGKGTLRPVISRVALVFMLTTVLILLSGGLVIASAKSLPGDSLYPVKLAVEDITVYLVPSREIKQEYEVNYSQQRVEEVNRLIALQRMRTISFEGVLEEKNGTSWRVSGIPVSVQDNTILVSGLRGTDPYLVGSVVEIEGTTNLQGGVTASEIHLREVLKSKMGSR